MNKIIALVGMCGSGKTVACDHFEELGYKKVYFGGVTLDELKKAKLPITPENEQMMREKIREEYGMGGFATLLLPKIEKLYKKDNVVIDGLYSWEELIILKEHFKDNMIVLAVVVDKNIRYERLEKRSIRGLNKKEAKERDLSEIVNLKKGGPIAYADLYVDNSKDIPALYKKIDELLEG